MGAVAEGLGVVVAITAIGRSSSQIYSVIR